MTKWSKYTGIELHQGRKQPFTVWVEGWVVRFTETRAEAEVVLSLEVERARRQMAFKTKEEGLVA